jgi:hypothetical protein
MSRVSIATTLDARVTFGLVLPTDYSMDDLLPRRANDRMM